MPSLHETETQFAKAILGGRDADELIVSDWLRPEQRLAIYQYHYKSSLRDVLATTFPVVARLVGGGFFNGMAAAFTLSHPPARACLAEYGGAFPDFIGSYGPAQSLPYLADVALFEWLMAKAAHAVDYKDNAFYSRYPIGRIWETNQADYRGDDIVNLDEGGGWFMVEKTGGMVTWRELDLRRLLAPNGEEKPS